MITFREWTRVTGRGWIALMMSDDPDVDIPALKPGKTIEIDGQIYTCVGVEFQHSNFGYAAHFGVLIRGEPKNLPV